MASRVVKIQDPAVRALDVVHQDGTPVTRVPAQAGETVLAYLWDPGVLDPGCVAGSLATSVLTPPIASIDGQPARVTYAGTVPGFLCGLKQVNVEVPRVTHSATELVLTFGSIALRMPVYVDPF